MAPTPTIDVNTDSCLPLTQLSSLSTPQDPKMSPAVSLADDLPNTDKPVRPAATLLVTHSFLNGEHVARVPRSKLGALENEPRTRRVSVVWQSGPHVVLVAVTPHSGRAMAALPVLLAHLHTLPDLTVAVPEGLADHSDSDIALVNAPGKHERIQGRIMMNATDVDLVICLGGDGLIFHVISELFPTAVPPVMPFNMGSMGFLTPFEFVDHERSIQSVLHARKCVTMRMRLRCVVERAPADVDGDGHARAQAHAFADNCLSDDADASVCRREEYHVLNDLVIDRGPAPYLSNLEVLCDDCPVTRVQADGLIVATPTGSTAYSLSSGGSMVHPSVPAILFTPICPHSLSFRPVLFPEHVTLQIKVPKDSRATAWVSFDGRHRKELMRGDRVVVSVSPWWVPTFTRKDTTNDWFASVSQCLRWNERVVQGSSEWEADRLS